jgi:F-type H+-transporting ATPase subunit b
MSFLSSTAIVLLFAASGGGSGSGFSQFYERYFNIPGFEAWRFLNLIIFVALLVYILRRPLGEAFKARREEIRADLIKAEQERQAALERLTAVEARLAQLESEKEAILKRAREEADADRRRLAEEATAEIEKVRRQAEMELSRIAAQARATLRRYTAEESIRLAEEKIRNGIGIDSDRDVKLVRASINEIGGLN